MRFLKSYGIALVLILLIAGWLASGTLIRGGNGPGNGEQPIIDLVESNEPGPIRGFFESIGLIGPAEPEAEAVAEAEPEAPAEELQSVRVQTFTAEQMPLSVTLRGRTEANAISSVRPETSGVVETVHVSKGDQVAPGDLLCTLDKGTRAASVAQAQASVAQAEAALDQAQANFDTNAQLREKGVASPNSARQLEVALANAKSNLRAAQTGLESAEAELARTEIRSEVRGTVQAPLANEGDLLSASAVCATIVQLDTMRFVGTVAESKIGNVQEGMPAAVSTVTGQSVDGTVSYIAASADEATRSFEVNIEIDNSDRSLRDGVTAEAQIQLAEVPAHLLPQSVLTLDSEGALGVRTVAAGTAHFTPVEIIRDTVEGVWVAGLPAQVDVITLGQEYVVDGQQVAATNVDDSDAEAQS